MAYRIIGDSQAREVGEVHPRIVGAVETMIKNSQASEVGEVHPRIVGAVETMIKIAHPKPNTNNNPTAIPSFGPGAPPPPPSTSSSMLTDKSLRRSLASAYPIPPESRLPTPTAHLSSVPSPVDSIPQLPRPTTRAVRKDRSAGSNPMQISATMSPPVPLLCSHAQVFSANTSTPQISDDHRHETRPPKKTSSACQHTVSPTPSTLSPGRVYDRNDCLDLSMFHLSFVPFPPSWPIFYFVP